MNINIVEIKEYLTPYMESIKNFHFYADNPLFWALLFLLAIALIFTTAWRFRKAFSFCILLAIILLATTAITNMISNSAARAGESFDPMVIHLISGFAILLLTVYYLFIYD